jgi:hypothetical protein
MLKFFERKGCGSPLVSFPPAAVTIHVLHCSELFPVSGPPPTCTAKSAHFLLITRQIPLSPLGELLFPLFFLKHTLSFIFFVWIFLFHDWIFQQSIRSTRSKAMFALFNIIYPTPSTELTYDTAQ